MSATDQMCFGLQVAAAAAEAARAYEVFIEGFLVRGDLPLKVKEEQNEGVFLTAIFHYARVQQKLHPDQQFR